MAVATAQLDGVYEADPYHSSFLFAVKHMNVSSFRASFADADARLEGDDSGLRLEGSARVESVSIQGPPEFREHVVRGQDFFNAERYPEISFRSTRVVLAGDGTAEVEGELTIKGNTKAVRATGSYQPPVEDPYGSRRAALELRSTIDRRDWGMDWQASLPGGGDALGYEVELTAHLELVKRD